MGLLDDLKKQAELAKSQQISEKSLQAESLKVVETKAKQTFQYLNDLLKQLAILYIKWGSAAKINIEKDMPAPAQKIRDGLTQNGVKFAEDEMRSPRGTIAGWKFTVDQAINTDVKITADHANLRLMIAGRNLIRLGSDDFVVPILEITEEWLEEFAKSLLGHPSGLQKYKVQTPFR